MTARLLTASACFFGCALGGLNVDEQQITVTAAPCFRLYNSTGFVGCSSKLVECFVHTSLDLRAVFCAAPEDGTLAPVYGISNQAHLK
jgi:hypothetical protein